MDKAKNPSNRKIVNESYGALEEQNPDEDLEFWLQQDSAVKLAAVWELTMQAYLLKGVDIRAQRFPRSIGSFQPAPR